MITLLFATENDVAILAGVFKKLSFEEQLPGIADQVAEGLDAVLDGKTIDGLQGQDIPLDALVYQAALETGIATVPPSCINLLLISWRRY